jgi:hypothetical protein
VDQARLGDGPAPRGGDDDGRPDRRASQERRRGSSQAGESVREPLGLFRSEFSRELVSLDRLLEIVTTQARGVERAIKARNLIAPIGLGRNDAYPERTIRAAVRELVRRGYPIGSSTGTESGYFLVTDKYELADCMRNLNRRAVGNIEHAEDLRHAFHDGPRQGVVFEGLP